MQNIIDHLENTAARVPDKTAFTDADREISFSSLNDEVKRLGTYISRKGLFQKPVCIFMDKSIESIVSMLGIVSSGNFYSVIDTEMPETRIQKILEVLKPSAVVTTGRHAEKVSQLLSDVPDADLDREIIIYENIKKCGIDHELLRNARMQLDNESLIFVLFTSGSTGTPKGVMIKHKAFPPYLKWYADTFSIDETSVIANQAPFYFIMSCPDIYLTVMTGATCHIMPKKAFAFPMVTLKFLDEHKVNTIYWVPSVLCMMANFRALPELHVDSLKLVMFGGEVMPAKQLNMWRKEYPDVRFVNLYGPTETTEMISYYEITTDIPDNEALPIGKPVSYLKTFLLDENGNEAEPGCEGELCAAGISIAGGYYNMPEKTAEVFAPNPLYKEGDDPEERIMYRTGDLAKIDENGDLVFLGRKDYQIKHMGNRIELGEIETAASSVEGVDTCCCLYDHSRQKIVLFYSGRVSEDDLDSRLKSIIPAYMVPNRLEKLDVMPRNINGKLDRQTLKSLI